jgi:hypothetical protein
MQVEEKPAPKVINKPGGFSLDLSKANDIK